MSNEVDTYYGAQRLVPADRRRVVRGESRTRSNGLVRQTAVDVETDVAIGKVDNTTMATLTGMRGVLAVAKAQEALEQMSPAAAGRLAMLADDHAIGIADELAVLRQRMRRI